MKSYTDLEQSRKLAEFLPVESADMRYGYIAPYEFSDRKYDGGYDKIPYTKDFFKVNPDFSENEYDGELPCWSLAALLNYLREIDSFPEIYVDEFAVTMNISYFYHDVENEGRLEHMDSINVKEETFIDACVEMIYKLKENYLI